MSENEISVQELQKMREEKTPHQLIDIREEHELANHHIGGEHIPMADILQQTDKIARDKTVVIHCNSGKRSAAVVHTLRTKHAFENVYSLKGGIVAWIEEIGHSVSRS